MPSPLAVEYLRLEPLCERAHGDEAEALYERMCIIWADLSDEERKWLDSRPDARAADDVTIEQLDLGV